MWNARERESAIAVDTCAHTHRQTIGNRVESDLTILPVVIHVDRNHFSPGASVQWEVREEEKSNITTCDCKVERWPF